MVSLWAGHRSRSTQHPGQTPRPTRHGPLLPAPPNCSRSQTKPTEPSRASKTHQNLIHNPQRTQPSGPKRQTPPNGGDPTLKAQTFTFHDTATHADPRNQGGQRVQPPTWRRTGSNRRPPACKAGALPTELRPHAGWNQARPRRSAPSQPVVGQGGLEPPTPRLSSVCSNQLSY